MKIEDKCKEIELKLKQYSKMNCEELFKEFNTSINGLSFSEIEKKQEQYGKNILDIKNNNTMLKRLKEALINPFNIV